LPRAHAFPDPVVGRIELPPWLVDIQGEPAVRRMLFIRQLGLKAYVDFPGAIHTRFSHALGVMQLAGRVVDSLAAKMQQKPTIVKNLTSNKQTVMAAGFLHDIAHGPFSHALDFSLYSIKGKSHEALVEELIQGKIAKALERWSISTRSVIQIINRKHEFPFLSEIVNGPIDVDKLDYLLRDAYHIGLRYSFDLDYFISQFSTIGQDSNLQGCKMGLSDSDVAVVTADLFLMIWKSMYDLVYYIQDSRIAEKMLEKAILKNAKEEAIVKSFDTNNGFLTLQDERLFETLETIVPARDTVESIRRGEVFKLLSSQPLDQTNFEMSTSFIAKFDGDENDRSEVSDLLSRKLCEDLRVGEYQLIVDILRSRQPSDIPIDYYHKQTKEWDTLGKRSKIFKALSSETKLKVYLDPKVADPPQKEAVQKTLKVLIEAL